MDFDTVKENIQPLRQGRNAERLGLALSAESQEVLQKELIQQRKEYELEIQNYKGEDPLELWYEYISWIEQSYPKSGKETHLDDVLIQCISAFENVEKYQQDRRMIKIYMKYIDNQPNPQTLYQELYNQGIGTMVADLYIGWAYYYDAADNFKKTEEIYQKGLRARAQPLEDLEQAHKQFGFSMSQRILYKDEPGNQQLFRSSLEERRTALTSLRTHKKRHVGTSRTGLAIKSERPGQVLQENLSGAVGGSNTGVSVFKEEEESEDTALPKNESIIKSLVDSQRTRENTHEPGPWNKAKLRNSTAPLITEPPKLGFKILEDDSTFTPIPYTIKTFDLGFQRPLKFVAKNKPQTNNWDNVPLVIPEPIDPKGIPMYSKSFCYPGNGKEYSGEEYHGYRWFKKRGVSNKFTLQHDPIWDDAYECGIRIPPNFALKNLPQKSSMEYLVPMQDQPEMGFTVDYAAMLITDATTGQVSDKSNDELMAEKWRRNPKKYTESMNIDTDDLEETIIGDRRVSIMPRFSMMPGRQSILPERKSIIKDRQSILLGRRSEAPEPDNKPSSSMAKSLIDHVKLEFKTPQVPGINRKSILPRKSIMPQTSNLSPIKDNSVISESKHEELQEESETQQKVVTMPQFEIFSDEPMTNVAGGQLGSIKRDSLLKRKLDTPDKMIPNKNVCAIDTPEKYIQSPETLHPEEPTSNFDAFVVPKLPSPIKQKQFQIFEDEQPIENQFSPFNQNESMCTMNFNQCIETGSMSTPIKIQKRTTLLGILEKKDTIDSLSESPIETNQQNISSIIPPTDQENVDLAQMGYNTMPKQLSTIMETTETTSSTGLHTKSTIGSPESDNDTEVQAQKGATTQVNIESEEARTVPENSMAPPVFSIFEDPTENIRAVSLKVPSCSDDSKLLPEKSLVPVPAFSIFEDKTENMKAMSLQAPSLHIADDSKLLPEKSIVPVPAFSIFEDKTENMKAISLQAPTLNLGNDTAIVNKENLSRAIFVEIPLESIKVPNESAFPAYDDDMNDMPKDISSINKNDARNSMLSFKEPVNDIAVAIKNLSIRMKETSMMENPGYLETEKDPTPENSMLAMSMLGRSKVPLNDVSPVNIKSPIPVETNVSKCMSDDFYDSFCKSPVKTQTALKTSIQGHHLDKTQNYSIIHENVPSGNQVENNQKIDSVKKLISFEVSKNESQKVPIVTNVRKSDNFYDLFAKSPEKPGKFPNLAKIPETETNSGDISSLLKFDSSNNRDTTQAFVNLNLADDKCVSMVAKGETPVPTSKSLLHESQIKQEKSLHITDRLSTFAAPEMPANQFKKPLFAEDDNINTMMFASNMGSVQNSTFIAAPEPDTPIFGITNVQGGVRMTQGMERDSMSREKTNNTLRNTQMSLSMDEEEFMKVAVETPVKQEMVKEPEKKAIQEHSKIPVPASKLSILKEPLKTSLLQAEMPVEVPADDLGASIYVPVQSQSVNLPDEHWDEVNDDFDLHAATNQYLSSTIDLNGTRAFIQEQLLEEIIDPFDKVLLHALLDQVDFINYLRDLPTCSLRNKICQLAKGQTLEFGNETFDVIKAIGKGSYGVVYTGKCRKTGQVMALKQERPANLWEYYICLEIRARIVNPNVLCGFMNIDYSLIGTNASILVSEFSKFGTIIDVCNKIKKATNRNMDECIVMHITNQILDIMDHLHSSQIIHADIKPDNFLLMTKIDPENLSRPVIQLIDFGVAIDMQLLQNMHPYREVQFKLVAEEDPCIEMRENKPWTYQVDLYGVAGTAHAMLFGRYMEVHQKFMKWEIKTKLPRYFQKDLWEIFFEKLLNIRSCKEMPNLQDLRVMFKEELQNKDKVFKEKINEFNMILLSS